MSKKCDLIVMLTHNDHTVPNAYEIFEKCIHTQPKYWGFKEKGLPFEQMKKLCSYIKSCGKTAVLEVVAYTEQECIQGACTAIECGFDILMGTLFYDSVNNLCKKNGLKYMPFVGSVTGRPSVLEGNSRDMIAQAEACLKKGVYGFDLLAYRYTGNPEELIFDFTSCIDAPVCIAGSINSFDRLNTIKKSSPRFFTIGGAFFENRFGDSIHEQIDRICSSILSDAGAPV